MRITRGKKKLEGEENELCEEKKKKKKVKTTNELDEGEKLKKKEQHRGC